jgi:hypothetical protein
MGFMNVEAAVRVAEAAAAAPWELVELAAVGSPVEQAAAWSELWTPAQQTEAMDALRAAADQWRRVRRVTLPS